MKNPKLKTSFRLIFRLTFLVMFFCISLPWLSKATLVGQEREWVDSSGTFRVVAELVTVDDQKVVLKKRNGININVPLSKLSIKDLDHLQALSKPSSAAGQQQTRSDAQSQPNSNMALRNVAELSPSFEPNSRARPLPRRLASNPTPFWLDFSHRSSADDPPRPEPQRSNELAGAPSDPVKSLNSAQGDRSMGVQDAMANNSPVSSKQSNEFQRNTPSATMRSRSLESGRPSDAGAFPARQSNADAPEGRRPIESAPTTSNETASIRSPNGGTNQEHDLVAMPAGEASQPIELHRTENVAEVRRQLALLNEQWLGKTPEDIRSVAELTLSDDKFVRKLALQLIAKHDSVASFGYILERLNDTSFEVRWLAYDTLEKLGDERAIEPLVRRFRGDDRSKIASVLTSFGSKAEGQIIPFLQDSSRDIRLSACSFLSKVGTTSSIPYLEPLRESDTELLVRMQAKNALRKITSRQ